MLAPWAIEEMKTVDLPDKRLNERLAIVLSQLAGQPTASIPAACGGYAETAAAYRLFENERLSFKDVLQPHIDDSTDLGILKQREEILGRFHFRADSKEFYCRSLGTLACTSFACLASLALQEFTWRRSLSCWDVRRSPGSPNIVTRGESVNNPMCVHPGWALRRVN